MAHGAAGAGVDRAPASGFEGPIPLKNSNILNLPKLVVWVDVAPFPRGKAIEFNPGFLTIQFTM